MKIILFLAAALAAQTPEQPPYILSEAEAAVVRKKMSRLEAILKLLPADPSSDQYAEAAIFHKAADWIMRHPEEFLTKAYYDNTLKALDTGLARAAEAASGKPSWPARKGRLARAYRSRVDGSVQPYAVNVPESYDGATSWRLDVVLHGRNARLNEVSFLAEHEWGKPAPLTSRIELHIYGRTNNAYRWAGETDVFEALAALQRHYRIDPNRIVLRGFSMGGAGAWHLGLHHPDRWAAIEAGAGFSDTLRYARLERAPEHEKRVWPIYDSYLYAANARMLPVVGYGSIDDPQLQASVNIRQQLAAENITGLAALFIVGPRIGHRFAPESKQQSEEFIEKTLARERKTPDRIQFLTYTARYGNCHWIQIDRLEKQYQRGEVDARREATRVVVVTKGVMRLAFAQPEQAEIDGVRLNGPIHAAEKRNGTWRAADRNPRSLAKRRGLQGPIDDAFRDSFLCVRPTGQPAEPAINKLSLARLDEFRKTWDKFLRGDIRIKDDRDVTPEDIRNHNLVLFGDAGSNSLMARVLPKIPVRIKAARNQMLTAIYPNPLNPSKYVVLNSGHTFGEKEFRGTNALLYPRFGDWAVLDENGGLITAGFFDENWR
jgi:pimeloyl-ACP methyl ester carboxylesterase